jgi:hypothetical protein
MWDGREPSLQSQATDATLGHAQASAPPTDAELAAIVAFETNIFDAQVVDFQAGYLAALGATGGPVALAQQEFYQGINDSLSAGFNPIIFTDYAAWEDLLSSGKLNREQASVARGEMLFNTKTFTINGVNGLNLFASDPLGTASIVGTCGTAMIRPTSGIIQRISRSILEYPTRVRRQSTFPVCRSSPSPVPLPVRWAPDIGLSSPIWAKRLSAASARMSER